MKNDVETVLVQMPPVFKREIVRRARATGSNANDVVVAELAKHYRVSFKPTGRLAHPGASAGPVVLRVPRLLKRRLQVDALEQERPNLSDRVLAVLAEAFAVEL